MHESLCVCIVDDDSDQGTSLLYAFKCKGIEAQWFPSAEAFLASEFPKYAGCLILDISLPGMSGLILQSVLNEGSIRLPVIVISGRATASDAIRAFESGASAFVEKPFDIAKVVSSSERLLHVEHDRRRFENERACRLASLTDREQEILQHLIAGKNVKSIGRELGISSSTVEKHRANVLLKTGVESVVELTRFWLLTAPTRPDLENFASRRFDKPARAPKPPNHSAEDTSRIVRKPAAHAGAQSN